MYTLLGTNTTDKSNEFRIFYLFGNVIQRLEYFNYNAAVAEEINIPTRDM